MAEAIFDGFEAAVDGIGNLVEASEHPALAAGAAAEEERPTGQPEGDKVDVILGVQITVTFISLLLVLLRLYTRAYLTRTLGFDDALIIMAWLFSLATCIVITYACAYVGLGQHNVNLLPDMINSWNGIQVHVTWMAVYANVFVRLSIVTFYLRLSSNSSFQRICYVFMVVNGIWGVLNISVDITTCIPARKIWMPEVPGVCRDPVPFDLFAGTFNILLDLSVLLLPLPMIRGLSMDYRQKVGLQFTFAIGLIAVVAGAIRLPYLVLLLDTSDYTYEQWGVIIWSAVELNLGIVGACIPALEALIHKAVPRSPQARSHVFRSLGKEQDDLDSDIEQKHSRPLPNTSGSFQITASSRYGVDERHVETLKGSIMTTTEITTEVS